MEKQKGIPGSSAANANVGRSTLADVSNVKSNSSRIFGGDASKRKEKGGKAPAKLFLSYRLQRGLLKT
ncbi:hypothetical protein ACFX2J_035847 [Malus domestica]